MSNWPELSDILLEQDQSVLFATLNRPQTKNALTGAMVEGLMTLCDRLAKSRDIRALVLRGAGGSFCAGGDIKDFGRQLMAPQPKEGEVDPVAAGNRVFGDLLLKLDALPQVVVTVVEGAAFGGANGLIAVSDVVIGDAKTRMSLSETTLGLPPAQIGPFLVRRIGLYATRRLALTGARFTAAEAAQFGLIDSVVSDAVELDERLNDTLTAIGRCEPQANAATKNILNNAASDVKPEQLDAAARAFAECLRGKGREGAAAFAAKQPAPWIESYTVKKEA